MSLHVPPLELDPPVRARHERPGRQSKTSQPQSWRHEPEREIIANDRHPRGRCQLDESVPLFAPARLQISASPSSEFPAINPGLNACRSRCPGETIGDLAVVMEDRCSTSNMLMVATQWETDTEFTLTVTDTITNQTKQYFNPQGTAPSSFFDFAAFATCPS